MKYTKTEIALEMALEAINCMDFELIVDEDEGFSLEDLQYVNLGDIEFDRFETLQDVLERMSIYKHDYFFEDYIDRREDNQEIDKWDVCKTFCAFLISKSCNQLLKTITPKVYKKIQKKLKRASYPGAKDFKKIIPLGMIFWNGDIDETDFPDVDVDEFYDAGIFRESLAQARYLGIDFVDSFDFGEV